MRETRTADELKTTVENALGNACHVEIVMDPIYEVKARIVSNPVLAGELQRRADRIMQDVRARYILSIRRADAQAAVRDELGHPAAAVQIVGNGPADYRVEVRGGGTEAQRAAETIFARLKRMYDIV